MLRQIRNTTGKVIVSGILVAGTFEITTRLPSEGRASEIYHSLSDNVATPLMRKILNPEDAHDLAIYILRNNVAPTHRPNPLETTTSVNLESKPFFENNGNNKFAFTNCIGLAAGFDKDGVAIKGLMELGFGFVEIGSVTPKPQPGNPKPRMFRLLEDGGIINRYGFNSCGIEAVLENLKSFRSEQENLLNPRDSDDNINIMKDPMKYVNATVNKMRVAFFPSPFPQVSGMLGVNLGKNKASLHETSDYEEGIKKLGPYADYLVVNISSPNTPGLRDLQKIEPLRRLLKAAVRERDALAPHKYRVNSNMREGKDIPLLVKIAPDVTDDEMKDIAAVITECKIDGVIVSNTSISRPDTLRSKNVCEGGGLSGLPIRDMSTECIRKMYKLTSGNVVIIGVGGVGSGHDAYEKLKAGASAVQIYSRMVYEGPGVVSKIRKELSELMVQNGQKSVDDVIGLDHEKIFWDKRQIRVRALLSKENLS